MELCGEEKGYVAILHSDKSEHALNLAKSKLEKIILDTRLIIRGIYKGKVISLYKNGKIAIKDVDRKEAEYILKDLLS
jgi:hypothetical protein